MATIVSVYRMRLEELHLELMDKFIILNEIIDRIISMSNFLHDVFIYLKDIDISMICVFSIKIYMYLLYNCIAEFYFLIRRTNQTWISCL